MCRRWWWHLQEEVWGRQVVRKELRRRNLGRWLEGGGEERRWRVGEEGVTVYSLCCDHYLVRHDIKWRLTNLCSARCWLA